MCKNKHTDKDYDKIEIFGVLMQYGIPLEN